MQRTDTDHRLYVGIMTGSSLDGIDAVLASFEPGGPKLAGHVRSALTAELRGELLRLSVPGPDELHRAAVASQHLARGYAQAVEDLLLHAGVDAADVAAIGAHGQTVRHRPDAGYTIQLNAPATLAELTGIDVVADFRSRDMAAGGQGAPLVPAFHARLFGTDAARAVVNIGGIANLTVLPPGAGRSPDPAPSLGPGQASRRVSGFDCGPGNVLIDAWAAAHLDAAFDRDGAWAAGGHSNAALLELMLQEPYFALPPPKSTGRELFDLHWIDQKLAHRSLPARDVQATLTRLTAAVIGRAVAAHAADAADLLVCGGGAFNPVLMRMLQEECAPRPVRSTAHCGVEPDQVEALAFAWLAREHLARRPASLADVTGARGSRVLGALYPGQ